jgi:hypothetical protein
MCSEGFTILQLSVDADVDEVAVDDERGDDVVTVFEEEVVELC